MPDTVLGARHSKVNNTDMAPLFSSGNLKSGTVKKKSRDMKNHSLDKGCLIIKQANENLY